MLILGVSLFDVCLENGVVCLDDGILYFLREYTDAGKGIIWDVPIHGWGGAAGIEKEG